MLPPLTTRLVLAFAILVAAHASLPSRATAATQSIALAGETAPDTGGGVFGLLGQPDLNDDGEVVFFATVAGGTSGQGIFVGDGAAIRAVATQNSTAPGGAGTFAGFFLFSGKIDDQGDVAFLALLSGGASSSGLFLEGPSGLEPIALVGGVAPGTGGTYVSFGAPDLNDDGELAFVAAVLAFPPTSGIFVESDLVSRKVVEVGDPVPGVAGASFEGFGNPVLNDNGQVAFTADVDGPGGALTGVWVYSAAGVGTLIALENQVAPGTGGATFDPFGTDAPSIDAVGNVYFQAELSPVAGFDAFFVGDGATITPLVIPGESVPGMDDPTIDSLPGNPEASRSGGVAYVAFVDDLVGSPSDEGVYFDASAGAGRFEIAREDDVAPDTGGGTLTGFTGRASPNVSGEVAFLCGVAGSPTTTIGIFVPEPTASAMTLAGAVWLAALAGRSRPRRTGFA